MSLTWILGAVAAGALLGMAALAAERIAAWFRLPRRWAWAAAMAASLALPVVALAAPGALPHLRVPTWLAHRGGVRFAPGGPAAAAPSSPGEAVAAPASAPERGLAAFALAWVVASLATAGALAWTQRRLRSACGKVEPRLLAGDQVFVSERAGPMVLGVIAPRIVLPRWVAGGADDELRLIVRHEREHVRAGDPWLLALSALAVAAMPWSPALWWMHRRLRLAVETDCDARVLGSGESRGAYGRVLLRTAARGASLPAPSLAWGGSPSHLERRIVAMTEPIPRRRGVRALPLAAFACAAVAAACTLVSGDGATAADTRETREVIDGRLVTTRDNADGSTMVAVAPDPKAKLGYPGFSWGYDYSRNPIQLGPGRPVPRNTVYPTVRRVAPGSPAETAGLMEGDVFLSSNGVDGRVTPLMPDRAPGAAYDFRVRRGREVLDIHLVLGPPQPPGLLAER